MNEHPIWSMVKVGALLLLAVVVMLSFWQGNRREDAQIRLQTEVGQLRADLAALAGRLRSGTGVAVESPTGSSATPGAQGPAPLSDTPPEHLKGRARELWGRFPNFLKPDVTQIPYPPVTTPGLDPNGRVRFWFQSAPSGLNPITKNDGVLTRNIKYRCMAYLCAYHDKDPDSFAPWLADRVEVGPDHMEYVIWLKRGVKWQVPQLDLSRYPHLQGEHEVTAKDVKFALDCILNPAVEAAALRSYYSECEGAEVVDDHCLIVRWKKKQWNSIAWTLAELAPMPEFLLAYDESGKRYGEDAFPGAFNDHWFYRDNLFLHCGPYVMTEFDKSSHCLLQRNEGYFLPDRLPPIREIYMEIFADRELMEKKLMAGEHDYGSVLPNAWDRLRKDPSTPLSRGKMEENWVWSTMYAFIAWKMTDPIFKDVKVRTAMTLACDRYRMNESLDLGKSIVISGPAYVNSPFVPPDLKPLPFDLGKARALLEEAGWVDADGNGVLEKSLDGQVKEFRFTATINNNNEWIDKFQIFKEDLSKIGVIMTLEPLQWGQFVERWQDRKFSCSALLWDSSGWDSDFHQIWHSSQIAEVKSSNAVEFSDPDVDRWIEEARTVFDPEKRREIQRNIHRRIAELQPYTFLHTTRLPLLSYPEKLQNVKAGTGYRLRPFTRLFPMFVPTPAR